MPLELDTFNYITKGGVLYKITDLQYFISRITLYMHGGGDLVLSDGDSIRYIDHRLPETQTWISAGDIPAVAYDSIAFTFGLNEQQNISNRFPNPLSGICSGRSPRWRISPHETELGVEKLLHEPSVPLHDAPRHGTDLQQPDAEYGFHHRVCAECLRLVLQGSSFTAKDSTVILGIVMNIDHWFNGPPNILDLNIMPQGIMQDQEKMAKICENGRNAFSVRSEGVRSKMVNGQWEMVN
ncbi:MAG: hypothetical protein MZU84_02090 [Sphingobacterium sp.]|nr:hypothetical protein [Sphingobacterium sp.]